MSTIFNHLPGKLRNIQSSRKKKKLLLCPSFTCALGWKDSAYFLAGINFHNVHCIQFPSFWPSSNLANKHSFSHHGLNSTLSSIPNLFWHAGPVPHNAAAYKFHGNILSFLTFTPWIAMEIQTEHWQWTSFHKNDFFYLLFLNLVRMEHSFCVMVPRW